MANEFTDAGRKMLGLEKCSHCGAVFEADPKPTFRTMEMHGARVVADGVAFEHRTTFVENGKTVFERVDRFLPEDVGGPFTCENGWGAVDVEACARAAYETRYADSLHLRGSWNGTSSESVREMWRKVARAVLKAAGR